MDDSGASGKGATNFMYVHIFMRLTRKTILIGAEMKKRNDIEISL